MNNLLYKKRCGTSGVSGQLYETKLLSLILFRALHDDDIKEFYLGTNVDGLGEFDDICLRFNVKGFVKPVAIFLQAKHRDDQNRSLNVTKTDLTKYFSSYLKIRNKFNVNSNDALFKSAYDDVECAFVFYTNAKDELNKNYNGNSYISKINDTISTGDDAFQLPYTDDDIKLLNKMVMCDMIERLATLISNIVRDEKGENYRSLMNDELIQTYHVILSQQVFMISDRNNADTDYRITSFNYHFFRTNCEHLQLLRDNLDVEALKNKKLSDKETLDALTLLFSEPSINTISKLIGSVITYNNKHFEYVDKKMNNDAHLREQLEKVNVTQSVVEQATGRVKRIFYSETFKLPAAFGNQDLTLSGNNERKDKRLCHLANKIVNLLLESNIKKVNDETYNIVYIDDDFPDKGLLRLNGGIAGAVGNLLILDKNTRHLMFENGNFLRGHAKRLFKKINSEIKELEKYRFEVKFENFPKLSFDCNEHDKSMVVDFTNKLLICSNQARESQVEQTLKEDIARLQSKTERCNFQIKSDAIFLTFHDEIQKWWMNQKNAKYLKKTCNLFQNTHERFMENPLLSVANVLHRNIYIKKYIKFDTKVVNSMKLADSFSKITMIISEVIAFSVIKLSQYINNDVYILLDLNYILSLPINDCFRLNEELTDVKDKIFILTYTLSKVSKLNKDIKNILQSLKANKLIVVTNNESVPEIRKYFANTDFFTVEDKCSLVDLAKESQEIIIKNTDVIFQGEYLSLGLLLDDDDSRVFIKGKLLDKIINGEIIQIGEPLTNSRYEEIKEFYVSRTTVNRANQKHNLKTFYDIDNHAVLITAEPGMGKSSLLTHLSLATKVRDPGVWIVRINLLDYSRFFNQWKENRTVVDISEALTFICIALFNPKECEKILLQYEYGEVFLKDCCTDVDSDIIIFKIHIFLNSCNRHKLILLFDGFDEICPYYEPQVIQFLKVLQHYRPREHRIWITSRTYRKILQSLEQVINDTHRLQPFNTKEQQVFIDRFLKLKLNMNELNQEQMEKVNDFMIFMAQSQQRRNEDEECIILYKYRNLPMRTIYLNAAEYFAEEIKRVSFFGDEDKYLKAWNFNVFAMKTVLVKTCSKRPIKDNMLKFLDRTSAPETPLHLYMAADYFQNEIKHVKTNTIWDLNFHTFAMYEHFVETKLKKIRFEEKNQMDLYRPDVRFTFEKERTEFINEHKKLAAYAMFFEDADRLFSEMELEEIRGIVDTINWGREKTGVIYTVIDGVPRFVHLSFAEYFAVEYICDLLKAEQSDDDLKSLWDFILNVVFYKNNEGVLNILDDKLSIDEELKNIASDARNRRIIFDLLMEQIAGEKEYIEDQYREMNMKNKISSSLQKAMSENLRNLSSLFMSTLDYMTYEYIDDIVNVLSETKAIVEAVILQNTEFTNAVLDTVRNIDPSKLSALFDKTLGLSIQCDGNTTNEQIVTIINEYARGESKDFPSFSSSLDAQIPSDDFLSDDNEDISSSSTSSVADIHNNEYMRGDSKELSSSPSSFEGWF